MNKNRHFNQCLVYLSIGVYMPIQKEHCRNNKVEWYHLAHMLGMFLCCNKRLLECSEKEQVLHGLQWFWC